MPWQKDVTAGGCIIHQIGLSYFKDIELIIAALVIFLLAFVVIVIWALKRPEKEIVEMENLPLENESVEKKEETNE